MSVENMIYIYLFICTSMIAFNIVASFLFKRGVKKTEHISKTFYENMNVQLERVKNGLSCEDSHKKYMQKKLKRIGNMIAFDKTLEGAYVENPDVVKSYLSELDIVFMALSFDYCGKDRVETAYFPYIIKKYRLIAYESYPIIEEIMLELLDEPNIYCRENALQALYTTGNVKCVMKAIKKIDNSDLFFHGKILSDGLLNFSGNTESFIDEIVTEFDSFSDNMKVTLLNYIRFMSQNRCEFIYSILCDETGNDEIRFSAIRYLGKYKYEKAYDLLCSMAENKNNEKWQYSAIASTALAIYPSEKTIEILKNNLYSKDWYVRFNSASSLKRIGVQYTEMLDVIDGNDRYASEILRYMLEKDKSTERGAARV